MHDLRRHLYQHLHQHLHRYRHLAIVSEVLLYRLPLLPPLHLHLPLSQLPTLYLHLRVTLPVQVLCWTWARSMPHSR